MSVFWRAAIAIATFLTLGTLAALAAIASGVLEDRREQRQAEERFDAIIADLDDDIAKLLGVKREKP